jgi:membrane protein required for beta-lactamase induction
MQDKIDARRELAIKRIKAKNDFRVHLMTYLTCNVMFVLIWYVAAVTTGGVFSFFWPILPLAGWGAGLIIHAYTVYFGEGYTEEQVQREMKALS